MNECFKREEMIIGREALLKLRGSTVAVFGVGGVGGAVVEALARGAVGKLVLIDNDVVSESNINRQLVALHSTIGKYKVDVAKERIFDICPETQVEVRKCFYLPENADEFDFTDYDYVVDAVDTVSAKLDICIRAKNAGVPVISAMGAGNKLDPTGFKVSDISKTKVCPLARTMRINLKKRGVYSLKCVYSEELPFEKKGKAEFTPEGKPIPGSLSFVPPVVGYILAGEVIKDIIKDEQK